MKLLRKSFLIAVCLLFSASTGFASITNDGNQAVRVIITKQARKEVTHVLNPNQSTVLPDDAISLKVNSLGGSKGDETVKVMVIHPGGLETTIEKYNQVIVIGEKPADDSSIKKGNIENQSNIIGNVTIHKRNKTTVKRKIYPDEIIDLPSDAIKVTLDESGRAWGDEEVNIKVSFPDGNQQTITSYGRSALSKEAANSNKEDISTIFTKNLSNDKTQQQNTTPATTDNSVKEEIPAAKVKVIEEKAK